MARHLVILAHADPSVGDNYRNALASIVDEPVDLVFCNAFQYGGLSSAYRQLAAELKRGGRLLPGILHYCDLPRPVEEYETITAASFSAGYALWREMLAIPEDFGLLDGLVGIDSWHSGFDPDGTARDSQLGGLVRMALRAKEGPAVCWLGHSDVQTPQPGSARPFASTTQVADEARRLAGGCGGGFVVKAYDVRRDQRQEHIAALTHWGDEWLADAVAMMLERRAGDQTETREPAPAPTEPLGVRALKLARAEQAAGVKEIRGPIHHPQILKYFAGCMRGGRCIGSALQSDELAWCAASASWSMFSSLTPGETPPHQWRAAVREIWLDALMNGTARSKPMIARGEYTPLPGDLLILTRGGPPFGHGRHAFAKTEGKGHTGRIIRWRADGTFGTRDGNVGDKWTDVVRHAEDMPIVGVVAHPQLGPVEIITPGDEELEGAELLWDQARRLMKLSDDVWHARGIGMDALDPLLAKMPADV